MQPDPRQNQRRESREPNGDADREREDELGDRYRAPIDGRDHREGGPPADSAGGRGAFTRPQDVETQQQQQQQQQKQRPREVDRERR